MIGRNVRKLSIALSLLMVAGLCASCLRDRGSAPEEVTSSDHAAVGEGRYAPTAGAAEGEALMAHSPEAPGLEVASPVTTSVTTDSAPERRITDDPSTVEGSRLEADGSSPDEPALEPEPDSEPDQDPSDIVQQRPGQLTAGEWRDLDNWGFWRSLLDESEQSESTWARMIDHWQLDTRARFPVTVRREGRPVADTEVVLRDGQGHDIFRGRTDNRGEVSLFTNLFVDAEGPFSVYSLASGAEVSVAATPNAPVELVLEGAATASDVLDLMFVIDTTGSMGDELRYLQTELENVVARARRDYGQELRVRISVNFYRDTTDAYTVRSNPFSEDLGQVLAQLRAEYATGGGDFPEAVEVGLADGVFEHEWSEHARARLMFWVADAPPHHTPQIVSQLRETVQDAARQGIRIIPLAGSGIDKETEFLMRFAAVATGGTYTFLTDHSGIGNGHIEPTVGAYAIEYLNDLLVRVIGDYVSLGDMG